jgi:thiamine biosynthesis protein ThiS
MKIILNHLPEEVINKEQMTIRELLTYKKYSFKMLVIKVNNQIIKTPQYESTIVKDGDDVIILHLMSGG